MPTPRSARRPLGACLLLPTLVLVGCLDDPSPLDCTADPGHPTCATDGSTVDGSAPGRWDAITPTDIGPVPRSDGEAADAPDAGGAPVPTPDDARVPDAVPILDATPMPDPAQVPDAAPILDAMPAPDAAPPPMPDAASMPEPGCLQTGCDVQSDRPFCDPASRRCVGCGQDDARCPPDRPICLGDRCARCDAIDHRGCDRASARPWCDAEREACVGCGRADGRCLDPARPECVEGVCRACDPETGDGCGVDAPICEGDGQGLGCRTCIADDECRRLGLGAACLDGACAPCDPADHAGCGPDALCCAGPNGPTCRPTDAARGCTACDVGCGLAGDACIDRQCVCGVGLSCAGEPWPYCVEGDCAACTTDDDLGCEGALGQCVAGTCRACDPADGVGCSAERPHCDQALAVCVACEAHAECGRFAETPFCVEGRCVPCEPGSDLGCAPVIEVCMSAAGAVRCESAACAFTDDWTDLEPDGVSEFDFDTRAQPGLARGADYRWSGCDGGGRTSVARLMLDQPAVVHTDILAADYPAIVQLRRGCEAGVPLPPAQPCRVDGGPAVPERSHGVLQPGVYFVFVGGMPIQGVSLEYPDGFHRGTGRLRVTVSQP